MRCAVVTGANKGVGFGTVRQLASNGVMVVLTARDEKRGLEAVEKLKECGISDLVVFHQLDITDPSSIASLADFVKTQFGKLDILVNNAGVIGCILNPEAFRALPIEKQYKTSQDTAYNLSLLHRCFRKEDKIICKKQKPDEVDWNEVSTPTYELAEECLKTNYHGTKRVTEALLPLLQLSDSPRLVNVSSTVAQLTRFPDGWAKGILSDAENLTEERVDAVLCKFLEDFNQGLVETKSWPRFFVAYSLSKAAVSAYTRILAKKYPNFCINCVCPGSVKTDMVCNVGTLTIDEGAESVVRLALLPNGGPTGLYFIRKQVMPF